MPRFVRFIFLLQRFQWLTCKYVDAGFMIVFVVFGVPLAYGWLLYKHGSAMNPKLPGYTLPMIVSKRDADSSIVHLRFLWEAYRPKYYAFEVFELIRKLAQTSLIVFIANGTATQIIIQLFISFVAISVLSGLQPYLRNDDNVLAALAQWIIFAVAFISLVVK